MFTWAEGHRQQWKGIEPARHAVEHHEVGDERDEMGVVERRSGQRDEDGDAREQRYEEDEDDDCHGVPPAWVSLLRGSGRRKPERAPRQTICAWRNTMRKQPMAMPP
ncbi:MAG: hypothetical protein FD152_4334 [Xanthobacteraceae bacterium]|nr:MAG: hypothetical protein FD152_4334 [Xanthobacteraceae bacterium]